MSVSACSFLIAGYLDGAHAACSTAVTTQQSALGGGTVTLAPNTCVNTNGTALYAQNTGVLEASQVTVTTTGPGPGAWAVFGGTINVSGEDPWTIASGNNGLVAWGGSTINASDLVLNTSGGARGAHASGGNALVTVTNGNISASGGGIGAAADLGGTITLSSTAVTVDSGFGLYAAGAGSTVELKAGSKVTATAATGAYADGGKIAIDASTITAMAGGTGVVSSGSTAEVDIQNGSKIDVTGGGVGALAQNGAKLFVQGSTVTVAGADGIQAKGGATVIIDGSSVGTDGASVNTILATEAGTRVDIKNKSTISVSGDGSTGVKVLSGAEATVTDSTIKMNGDAFGIDTAGASTVEFNGSIINGAAGTAIRALFGATLTGSGNIITGVTNGVVANEATVTLGDTSITTTTGGFALYATGPGASLTLKDGSSVTAGGAFAGYAENGASLTIDNSTVTAPGGGLGVLATGSGTTLAVTGGSLVTTTGTFAPAIRVELGATGTVADTAVETFGDGSYGLVAAGDGSSLSARNVTVTTHGSPTAFPIFAAAVVAEFGGTVRLEGTSTVTTDGGPNSAGLFGQSDGRPTLFVADASSGPITVETSGAGSPAAMGMNGGVRMELTGVTLKTTGAAAPGIYMTSSAEAAISGGSIDTTGPGSDGILLNNGATAAATNLTVTATGIGSSGLRLTGPGNNKATLDNVLLATPHGASISVENGTGTIAFTNSTAIDNNGVWLNVSTTDTTSPTVADITVDPSQVRGAVITDAASTSTVTLLNGSLWTMTGNSNITNLTNDASTIAFAAPTGDPTQAASYRTLTVTNYRGANGAIRLNTFLAGDGAPSDRLVIDGGVASGATSLLISNTGGGGGGTFGNGILVVQAQNGGVTTESAFMLGNRVAAGAYDYFLFRGGRDGDAATADNWYLRNAPAPQPPNPLTPMVDLTPRPEVPTNAVILPLAIQYGYAMLDTLHERVGETFVAPLQPVSEERVVWCKDAKRNFRCVARVPAGAVSGGQQKWFGGAWGRLFGNRGLHQPDNYWKAGPNYDYTLSGIQAGLDLWAREQADGTLDKAGLYIGYGRIWSDVRGLPGAYYGGKAGSVDMDAYTLGGYWSHFAPSGWYTDAVVQGTWYTDTSARSVLNEEISPDGFGILGSLEGGYAFRLGNGWTLEPQAQIVYQNVTFDNARDSFGVFRFQDGDSLRGRLGARLSKTWNGANGDTSARLITAWLRANIWHEFLGNTKTSVTGFYGENAFVTPSSLKGTWGELGAGVTAQISETVNLFATGAYQHALDGKGSQGWDGRLGATVRW